MSNCKFNYFYREFTKHLTERVGKKNLLNATYSSECRISTDDSMHLLSKTYEMLMHLLCVSHADGTRLATVTSTRASTIPVCSGSSSNRVKSSSSSRTWTTLAPPSTLVSSFAVWVLVNTVAIVQINLSSDLINFCHVSFGNHFPTASCSSPYA